MARIPLIVLRPVAFGALALASVFVTPMLRAESDTEGLRAVIVDDRLREREVRVLAIEPGALLLTDESGEEWRREIRGLIAVLPARGEKDNTRPPHGSGVIELADGQRFPGSLIPTASEGETARWLHRALGELTFSLEDISTARFGAVSVGTTGSQQRNDSLRVEDELVLVNGDILRGFLVGLGDPMIFETGGNESEILPERIGEIRLANDKQPAEGVYIWLGDGTIARADSIMTDGSRERLEFTLENGQRATYLIGALRGIAFDASRLVPLATLTPSVQSPTGERISADPIRYVASSYDDQDLGRSTLGLATIEFPGPMEVRYELPHSAVRIGGTFELDESTLPWGDCIVRIELDGRVLFEQRLHAEQLSVPFTLTAVGRELVIRIDPGNQIGRAHV